MTTPLPEVGETHTGTHTFTEEEIGTFARFVGDWNPLHHDKAFAAATRFGGLIASGTHTASIMMGVVATWTSGRLEAVGLGYAVRLRRHVPASMTCTITWRIASVEHNAKLGGMVVTSEGSLVRDDGDIAVTATSQALILDKGKG